MNQAGSEVITAEGVRWPGLPYGPKTDREMVSYVRTYTYTNIGLGLGIISVCTVQSEARVRKDDT